MEFYNIVGLLGTACYLVSYLLLQSGKIQSGYLYTLLNLAGAVLILYSLIYDFNLASAIIQVSWIIISLIGLGNIYFKNKKQSIGNATSN